MKNLFRRALTAIFIVACVFFGVNESVCSARFFTNEGATPEGRFYYAGAGDVFFQANKSFVVIIGKVNIILNEYPAEDFYGYKIEIWQRTDQNPFNIKSITIMSERDSVEIPAKDLDRQKGLDFVTDKIMYLDTGKVNTVIKSVWSKMLIRITTTNGVVYDFYASEEFISDAKKVAGWASR